MFKDYPVRYESLGSGRIVAKATLDKMAKIIRLSSKNWKVRSKAADIVSKIAGKDQFGEINALFDWVQANARYLMDPYKTELLITPPTAIDMIERGDFQGDCISVNEKIWCLDKNNRYELIELKRLKDSYKQYKALSYNFKKQKFEFKNIIKWIDKGKRESVRVSLKNGTSIISTPDHKFFDFQGRECLAGSSAYNRLISSRQVPVLGTYKRDLDELWIEGHFLAEGSAKGRSICLANDNVELQELLKKKCRVLGLGFTPSKRRKSAYIYLHLCDFTKDVLKKFGCGSYEKSIPDLYLSLNKKALQVFMEGYFQGDGTTTKSGDKVFTTVSKNLVDMLVCIYLVLGKPVWIGSHCAGVNLSLCYRIYNRIEKEVPPRYGRLGIAGYELGNFSSLTSVVVKKIESVGKQYVCDISVEGNHNFVLANGLVAHNCDDVTDLFLSLAMSIGYPVALRVASYSSDKEFRHVYGLVNVKHIWYPVDGINWHQPPGWEHPGATNMADYEV
jgi:Intein splicing domain